jgi:stress-induced-phosphoprotein 1
LGEQHNAKGGELFKLGSFPDAVKEYDEAIRRSPKEAKYYCNRGTTYMKLMAF